MNVHPAQSKDLWLYQWFEHMGWPRSYFWKVFLIAFIANHIPLLCFAVYFLFNRKNAAGGIIFLLLLLATLTGTALVFWALQQMLEPILLARRALAAYLARGQIVDLPTGYSDEVGLLLNYAARAIQRVEQSQLLLEQIAAEDTLTGLPNRRAADRQLQQSLSLTERQKLPLGVALLSIDNFQGVNERYGHEVGERVLVQLAQLLKANLRGGDWVAYWGGEEFLAVIFADTDGTRTALEQIQDDAANLNLTVASLEMKPTVSIGFTTARGAEKSQNCLERAAVALYRAKQAERNRIEFSPPIEI